MTGDRDADGGVGFTLVAFADLTPGELHDLLALRAAVFVLEQGIVAEPDIDGVDPACAHVLARAADGRLAATARLRPVAGTTKVERVAVRADLRGRGIGTALMAWIGDRLGARPAVLSAQTTVRSFYERCGWVPVGPPHEEAGVPHVRMERRPAPSPGPGAPAR